MFPLKLLPYPTPHSGAGTMAQGSSWGVTHQVQDGLDFPFIPFSQRQNPGIALGAQAQEQWWPSCSQVPSPPHLLISVSDQPPPPPPPGPQGGCPQGLLLPAPASTQAGMGSFDGLTQQLAMTPPGDSSGRGGEKQSWTPCKNGKPLPLPVGREGTSRDMGRRELDGSPGKGSWGETC